MEQFYETMEDEPVVIAKGKSNFYKILKEIPDPEKYRYSIKIEAEYRSDWGHSARRFVRNGVDLRTLVNPSETSKQNIKKWKKIYNNFREINNEGIALSIIDDKVVVIGLVKSNVTMLINNKYFAKIMKELYLTKYKTGKPL